ncbi:MAG: hypothetical protein ACFFBP_03185 [Promethearchaeota archaeon]
MIQNIKDTSEKNKQIQKLISDAIEYSKEISESEDYFEAGEFLYWAAEIVEYVDHARALNLYKQNIRVWEKQIESCRRQAQIREIAEIYLKIAEIYRVKFEDFNLEKETILNSIDYLIQETQLQLDFNEYRKLAHTYENIAELYLKLFDYGNAIEYYLNVIDLAKNYEYYDLLSFSYQQVAFCYEGLDDYTSSKNIISEGIDFFKDLFDRCEKKNDFMSISQIAQILKNLYDILNDKKNYELYAKKEATAYINLSKSLERNDENYQKMARYYRGAALCYQELKDNLIESASCFILAGNYSEKKGDYYNAAVNYIDAGDIFKELDNLEMAYKHFMKAGDNFWKFGKINKSTECYLNAYDIAVEGKIEFNRFGIFNQIVRGLNKIAEDGLKNQEFFTAATLILESIKFYEQLDVANDLILREMVRNVYKYYYRAANLKQVGFSHLVNSYFLAAISSILIGHTIKAKEIMSEIDSDSYSVRNYKKIINIILEWISIGKEVRWENFPYNLKRIMKGSEDIMYLIKLFRNNMLINYHSRSKV